MSVLVDGNAIMKSKLIAQSNGCTTMTSSAYSLISYKPCFSLPPKAGYWQDGSVPAIVQPKQEEALFCPVAISR